MVLHAGCVRRNSECEVMRPHLHHAFKAVSYHFKQLIAFPKSWEVQFDKCGLTINLPRIGPDPTPGPYFASPCARMLGFGEGIPQPCVCGIVILNRVLGFINAFLKTVIIHGAVLYMFLL